MKTKIKGRYGSVYYFGYEEPFLFDEKDDNEKEDEEDNPQPTPIEEPEKNTPNKVRNI